MEEEKVVGELGEEEMEIKEVAAVGVGGVKIIRIITTSQGLVKPIFSKYAKYLRQHKQSFIHSS